VLVRKKDGSTSVCIDYRQLNKKIIKDIYTVDKGSIRCIAGSKVLRLKNGFFHVIIDEQSRKYTAFIIPGHYEFLRVPFGLRNFLVIFQRFINIVFKDLIRAKFVLVYLDDLIVPSSDRESKIRGERVLQVANEAKLMIN